MDYFPAHVIDAHAHCGVLDDTFAQTCKDYQRLIAGTDIDAVAFFSPVNEIYDRFNRNFVDNGQWKSKRSKSNAFLLTLNPPGLKIYPYFFIWNDFAVEELTRQHGGIKWHRHANEPDYKYDDPKCRSALELIKRKNFPVILEETFDNTVRFIRELARGVPVIIPHLGGLNGGFDAIAQEGLWALDNVWADTALAHRHEIDHYLQRYGHQRLLFGSDFPFGHPALELEKVRTMTLGVDLEIALLKENFLRLQAGIVH